MARPYKSGLDYFGHDVNARNDPKLKKLIKRFGVKGYGRYFVLLELIYSESEGKLDVRSASARSLLCDELAVTLPTLHELLTSCLEIGLFSRSAYEECGVLTSDRIQRQLAEIQQRRERWRRKKEGVFPQENEGKAAEFSPRKTMLVTPQSNNKAYIKASSSSDEDDELKGIADRVGRKLTVFECQRLAELRSQHGRVFLAVVGKLHGSVTSPVAWFEAQLSQPSIDPRAATSPTMLQWCDACRSKFNPVAGCFCNRSPAVEDPLIAPAPSGVVKKIADEFYAQQTKGSKEKTVDT
jgi:hypothetical protein